MQAALWAQALQDSNFAVAIRGGAYLYPIVNVLHVLAVGFIVGSILALDFRVLGFAKSVPVDAASRLLKPFAVTGLLISIPSGFALYASDAVSLSQNNLMWIKLALTAIGVLNAFLFRQLWNARLVEWGRAEAAPLAKAQAVLSIVIWLTVPSLGRLVAYL
jgi:hypothetical protein